MISIFGKAFGKFVPDSNVAWAALCYEVHEKALRSPGGGGAFRWLLPWKEASCSEEALACVEEQPWNVRCAWRDRRGFRREREEPERQVLPE